MKKLTEKEVWLELARRWNGELIKHPKIDCYVPKEKSARSLLAWRKKIEAKIKVSGLIYPSSRTIEGARGRAEFCKQMAAKCK